MQSREKEVSARPFWKSVFSKTTGIYFFSILCAILFAFLVADGGVATAGLLIAAFLGLPIVYAIVVYPKFGIYALLLASYFVMWIVSMGIINFPLGTTIDTLEVLLVLGFFINQKREPDWVIFKDPIAYMILVWMGYNFIQFGNPTAESRMAWVYTIRSAAVVMLMYFIFSYYIRTIEFVRSIMKLWIVLSLFAALYAFKQEQFGFFAFEERTLFNDPRLRGLLFIAGHWRKSSIFSDPITFSYNMVISSLLCICLSFGPYSRLKKMLLVATAMFFLLTMLYSGTRGAYVLPPVALSLLVILKFNKQILMATIGVAICMAALIFVPSSNPNIRRFQTAFQPSDDPSFNLRKMNQKRIQPYIQTHPFGGGLGASGVWGERFAPHSFLAGFPPDSGYVRTAIELGSIGLLLFCTLMFVILRTGINNYFLIEDPELKTFCLAMVLIVFAIMIGNYPQEALIQFPIIVYFYLVAALINITYRLDLEKRQARIDLENKKAKVGNSDIR